jgi:CubicO group peptidase (beta-lactamase class C family)
LITTIAVLQCVEKGLFTLDEDVSRIVSEVGKTQVLTGFDENDKPQYEDKNQTITLNLLLTHSSGFGYDIGPPLSKWRALRGEAPMSGDTFEEKVALPLIAQPGTQFEYGVGVDWAGRMVERVTKLDLEDYFRQHIFAPLGIKHASFRPRRHEAIKTKMIDLNPDDPEGLGRAGISGFGLDNDPKDCTGGGGCYMSPLDYVKILHSILANDEKLLQRKTVDLMFEPHLPAEAHKAFNKKLGDENENWYWGQGLPVGTKRDYGYGGLLVQEAQPGWYNEGTMVWGGGISLVWFIDRKAGLCGMGAPQFHMRDMPAKRKPGEEPKPWREGGKIYELLTTEIKQVFREKIYEVYDQWKKGQA